MTLQEAASPTAAHHDSPPAVWIWHGLGHAGRWLPEALLAALGQTAPAIEPFAAGGVHRELAEGWSGEPPREAQEKRVHAALEGVGALSQGIGACDPGVLRAMAGSAAARQARHVVISLADSACRLADRLTEWPERPPVAALVRRDRELTCQLAAIEQILLRAGSPVQRLSLDPLDRAGAEVASWKALWAFLGVEGKRKGICTLTVGWQQRLRGDVAANAAALDAKWRDLLAREARWSAGLELPPAALAPAVHAKAGPSQPIRLTKLDRLPELLLEGDPVRLSGVVVPAALPAESRRLWMTQGERRQALQWGMPSAVIAARLPQVPSAAKARFRPTTVRASRHQPVRLECSLQAGMASLPVAELAFQPVGPEPIDGIYIAPWSIGYQPIPKAACTSIKEMLFRMTVGQPYSTELAEGSHHVHHYFDQRHRDVSAATFRFIVVRDPIKRFLSAYSSRVVRHRELSRAKVEHLQLDPPLDLDNFPFDPDLATFVDRYDLYRRIPTITHHCQAISDFCAPLASFDKVYPFENLRELVADLQRLSGQPAELPHSQRAPKISIDEVPPRIFDKLVAFCEADYEMLASLYSPSKLR